MTFYSRKVVIFIRSVREIAHEKCSYYNRIVVKYTRIDITLSTLLYTHGNCLYAELSLAYAPKRLRETFLSNLRGSRE